MGVEGIGASVVRKEDRRFITGKGRYVDDIKLAGMTYAHFIRSPHAHAKVKSIDSSAAMKMPGVLGVLTGQQIVDDKVGNLICGWAITSKDGTPMKMGAWPAMAPETVRFVGQAVAVVIAESKNLAKDAAEAVVVNYEELPAVPDIRAAIKPGAPQLHPEAPGNIIYDWVIGDEAAVKDAFSKAANVVTLEVTNNRLVPNAMEPRSAVAEYDAAEEHFTLYSTSQNPHVARLVLSAFYNIAPEHKLRVIAPDVGGGFGQKMSLASEYVVLVWLARKLKSSVAWTEDRRENLIAGFHSRDQYITLEGAFDKNAGLTALKADIISNVGAYSCFPTTCGVEPLMAMAELPGPYDVQQYQCLSRGVITNTCTMAPYRGVSRPVITFTLERLMDKAARAFAIDPVDIRRRNLIDRFPYRSAMGLEYDDATYKETLEMAVKAVDVPAFRKRQKEARAKGRHLGIGFATFSERTGYGSPAFAARGMEITPGWETVIVSVDPSGFVEAHIGSSPHGQGLRTTLAQIIADEIGVAPDIIKVVHGDTDRAPYGWGTFASRSLVISGGATLIAARKVRAKLIKIASHLLEAAPDDIVLGEGVAKVTGTDRSIPIARLAREAYTQTHRFKGEIEPGLTETGYYDPPGTFSNACHVAIVDVDVEIGHVRVEKFLVAEDAGRIINPMIADGQVHGGIAQGIGNALLEEIIYDKNGGIITATLADYLPPTAHEIPPIELHHIETPSPNSITKAKGLGEGGTIGAPAAVINAINDALSPFGVEIDEMPATPQRIRAALRNVEKVA
jgi:aerobic carbon-monoxide dehydrogenase large subunit